MARTGHIGPSSARRAIPIWPRWIICPKVICWPMSLRYLDLLMLCSGRLIA